MLWKIDFKVIQTFALKLLLMTSRTTILGIQEKYCTYAHDSLNVAIKNKTKKQAHDRCFRVRAHTQIVSKDRKSYLEESTACN